MLRIANSQGEVKTGSEVAKGALDLDEEAVLNGLTIDQSSHTVKPSKINSQDFNSKNNRDVASRFCGIFFRDPS